MINVKTYDDILSRWFVDWLIDWLIDWLLWSDQYFSSIHDKKEQVYELLILLFKRWHQYEGLSWSLDWYKKKKV